MKIEILGVGCPKCKQLTANAEAAVKEMNIEAEIVKVTDIDKITDRGIMMTPALVVDGRVVASGRLMSKEEIKPLLAGKKEASDEKCGPGSTGCCCR